MTAPDPHYVYRLIAADGRLLYIGCTMNLDARMAGHRRTKDWWPEVANIATERFELKQDALDAERAAILAEDPIHNRARWETIGASTPNHCFRCPDELWNAAKAKARAEGVTFSSVLLDITRRIAAGEVPPKATT